MTRLGMSGSEAAGVLATFRQMGVTNLETTKELSSQAELLATQSGVAPRQIMQDIAKASGEAAGYFRGNTTELIKSAVFARKMGIELTTMTNQADKLLDFESSVAAEMEASVLLGRQLNFDKARQLALEGDLAGASQAVLDQVGGLTEFNKLNIIQKKALASAAGLELGQLQKQLERQDMIANMTDDQVKKLEEEEAEAGKIATKFDEMMGLLKGSLREVFLPLATNLKNFLDKVMASEEGIMGMVNGFKGVLNSIVLAGKAFIAYFAFKAIAGVVAGISKISLAMKGISATSKTAGKGGGIMRSIIGKGGGKGLMAGAAALLMVSAALFVTAKALQQFAGVSWKSIGMAAVVLVGLVGAVAAIGAIMMSGVGAVAILAGAAALLILSVSLMAIGKAFALAAPGMDAFGKMTKNALEGIATIVTSVGDAIVKIIHQIGTEIKRLSDIPGSQLLSVAAGITAIGVSLAAYGGGSVLAGIGSFIGNLLGGDPVKRFERFAAASDGLLKTADAIQLIGMHLASYDFNVGRINEAASAFTRLARSLNQANRAARGGGLLGSIKGLLGLGGISDEERKALIRKERLHAGGIVTGPVNALVGEAGPEAVIPLDRMSEFSGVGTDMGPVVAAIGELKEQMAAIRIDMDGKTVGEVVLNASPGGIG